MATTKNAAWATSAQADNVRGPLVYNPDSTIAVAADTDFTADGWIQIGYGSTDGASFEQDADDNDKKVWGLNLGKTYSNFSDQATLHCASFKDANTLGLLYGTENVSTDTKTGFTHVVVKARQGTTGTWVIMAIADDGKPMLWVYRGTSDPNVSYDATEDDVITFDLVINGVADASGKTSEMFLQTADATPDPPAPAAKTTTTASGVKITATDATAKVGDAMPTVATFKASAVDKDGKTVALTLDTTGVDMSKAGSYSPKLSDGVEGDDPVAVGLTVSAA